MVFDLFGTLVRWPEGPSYAITMADHLGVPHDRFRPAWSRRRAARERTIKPDPRLYAAVSERLDVPAGACLYVANGERELVGAIDAGMRAVLFIGPGEFPGREAATWRGPQISVLADVLGMV